MKRMNTYSASRHMARPGFSLIEITAVILLIGILAAGAAVAILPQVQRAKINTTKNSMKTIKSSITTYMVENNQPPATLTELIPSFLEESSATDAWNNPYYYTSTPGGAQQYQLISGGKDGDLTTPEDNIDLWTMDLTN
ncbi:MAG: type II secretion system protein GspG [Phycisphaerales bacterium]